MIVFKYALLKYVTRDNFRDNGCSRLLTYFLCYGVVADVYKNCNLHNTVETNSSTKLKVMVVYSHPYPHSSGNMLSVDERYLLSKDMRHLH